MLLIIAPNPPPPFAKQRQAKPSQAKPSQGAAEGWMDYAIATTGQPTKTPPIQRETREGEQHPAKPDEEGARGRERAGKTR